MQFNLIRCTRTAHERPHRADEVDKLCLDGDVFLEVGTHAGVGVVWLLERGGLLRGLSCPADYVYGLLVREWSEREN